MSNPPPDDEFAILDIDNPLRDEDSAFEQSQLWIVSYSDFMTILMILFLMLFAHRVWAKKVAWEELRMQQLRAAQEAQKGIVQRLNRLVDIDVAAERINIHLPESLLFDAGKAELRGEAQSLLAVLAPEFEKFPGEIIVEGHTDDLPPGRRSGYGSNWELSVARAFSVIDYLTIMAVPPSKMAARGYGEYRPRAANDNPIGRAENRRIEIVLLNPKKSGKP